jgi:hypothetical protein
VVGDVLDVNAPDVEAAWFREPLHGEARSRRSAPPPAPERMAPRERLGDDVADAWFR